MGSWDVTLLKRKHIYMYIHVQTIMQRYHAKPSRAEKKYDKNIFSTKQSKTLTPL